MMNEKMFAFAGADVAAVSPNPLPDGSTGCDAEERIGALLDQLDRFVKVETDRSHSEEALGLLERLQTRVAAHMCGLTRQVSAANPEADSADVLRRKTRMSRREAKRMANVADRLLEMPKTAEKFAEGDITLEHAAVLANAADKVGPDAVESDPALLEEAAETDPDRFARRARDWSNRKLIEAGVNILERQRRAREAKLWIDRNSGMGMLFAKLPVVQFAHLQQAADNRFLQLLRQDTADGQDPDRVRTPKQRMADVMFELITNLDSVTGEPLADRISTATKASTQVVIATEPGVVDGTDPTGRCEIIGVGPAPPSILKTLSLDTELSGMIYDGKGRILWLGRRQRLVNAPQRLAVAIRDSGCFRCGAPMHLSLIHI